MDQLAMKTLNRRNEVRAFSLLRYFFCFFFYIAVKMLRETRFSITPCDIAAWNSIYVSVLTRQDKQRDNAKMYLDARFSSSELQVESTTCI
jgi:hypothetical protein